MSGESVSFRITRTTEDLAQTVAALVGDDTLAVVDVAAKKVTKTVKVTGALPEGADFRWSGPNCGSIQGERTALSAGGGFDTDSRNVIFKWLHPHPPCASTTDHKDVTVTVVMSEGGLSGNSPVVLTTCTYRGSESGTGSACTLSR